MNRFIVTSFALAVMLLPSIGQAQPPSPSMASQATQVISCPDSVNGVVLDRLHQYQVPSGWADEPHNTGGYSAAALYVNTNWTSSDGKTLYCGYATHRSPNLEYILVQVMRSAPGGRTCSKGANYTFRCQLNRMKLRPMR